MQWYKHYLTDYGQDTADLTFIQDAAYRRLLDSYYQREGPLPNDLKLLYRVVHAHSRHEQEAVRTVLRRYFVSVDGHFTNNRADKEIEQYQAQCVANRRPNRQRIVSESYPDSAPRIDREIERDKEGTSKPAFKPRQDTCIAVVDGKPCGKPGAHWRAGKAHCRDHGPL